MLSLKHLLLTGLQESQIVLKINVVILCKQIWIIIIFFSNFRQLRSLQQLL